MWPKLQVVILSVLLKLRITDMGLLRSIVQELVSRRYPEVSTAVS
jgi:hypothetical protein